MFPFKKVQSTWSPISRSVPNLYVLTPSGACLLPKAIIPSSPGRLQGVDDVHGDAAHASAAADRVNLQYLQNKFLLPHPSGWGLRLPEALEYQLAVPDVHAALLEDASDPLPQFFFRAALLQNRLQEASSLQLRRSCGPPEDPRKPGRSGRMQVFVLPPSRRFESSQC